MPRRIVTISIDEGLLAQVDALRGGVIPRSRVVELAIEGGLELVEPALANLRRVEKAAAPEGSA